MNNDISYVGASKLAVQARDALVAISALVNGIEGHDQEPIDPDAIDVFESRARGFEDIRKGFEENTHRCSMCDRRAPHVVLAPEQDAEAVALRLEQFVRGETVISERCGLHADHALAGYSLCACGKRATREVSTGIYPATRRMIEHYGSDEWPTQYRYGENASYHALCDDCAQDFGHSRPIVERRLPLDSSARYTSLMNESLLWHGLGELFLPGLIADSGMGFEWLSHGSQPRMAALLSPGRPVWDFSAGYHVDNGFYEQWFQPVYLNVGKPGGIHEAITTRLKPGDVEGVRSIVGAWHDAVGRREIDSPIFENADDVRARMLALLDRVEVVGFGAVMDAMARKYRGAFSPVSGWQTSPAG